MHCTNLYYVEPTMRLAKVLCENSFAERVFFSNSGAEANETALKLTRKYAKENVDPQRTEFITFKNSFHGRTFATLSASGQEKTQKGFEPIVPWFSYATFNDLASVEALITERTSAIMVEPIQGEGGFYPATPEFLEGLRRICDEKRLLLIFDEIQCGLGRAGRNFAYQHYGVTPDIMTLAKALGGGLPLSATLTRAEIAAAFTPGSHGGTMVGNPVAAAAALAFCEELFEGAAAATARGRGEFLRGKLEDIQSRLPIIQEIRGLGLMLAIRLDRPSTPIVKEIEKRGLLCGAIAGDAIRFLPPLIVEEEEIEKACAILEEVLREAVEA
jgi:acetylornithine/succinyldiaminopimelate/putrescine aminotransferase